MLFVKETFTNNAKAYASGIKYNIPRLKIQMDESHILPKGIDVKANVNMETGKVEFFIEQDELKKLKD